jgi:hypothetical protein
MLVRSYSARANTTRTAQIRRKFKHAKRDIMRTFRYWFSYYRKDEMGGIYGETILEGPQIIDEATVSSYRQRIAKGFQGANLGILNFKLLATIDDHGGPEPTYKKVEPVL